MSSLTGVIRQWGWLPGVAILLTIPLSATSWTSTLIATAFAALLTWAITAFAFADADFTLLSRGSHSADAFQGKAVLVTGASRGLGAAIARYLVSCGAKVVLSSRSETALQVR